ncbi:TauD/TfdA family dioxygenase [Microbacterium sp. C23T]
MSTGRRQRESIAELVLERILTTYALSRPAEITPWLEDGTSSSAYDLEAPNELLAAASALRSPTGRFRFHVEMAETALGQVHPMVNALRAADGVLQLGEEIEHPLELDPRDESQLYKSVMTVRVVPSSGVALSSEAMPFHQDGLGSAGSIRYVAMCLDAGPRAGGRQLYSNVLAHGLLLADTHWDRFVDATQPDALTVTRLAGKQHVSVTGPLFYIDESGIPAAHFRGDGGEYAITPSAEVASWFGDFTRTVASSAKSEELAPGDCLVVDNLAMVHARDAFDDREDAIRRLSRKWYAIEPSRVGVWTREPFRLHEPTYAG